MTAVRRDMAWAMAEHQRRIALLGHPPTPLEDIAVTYEIGNELLRKPRPTLWQRFAARYLR